VAGTKEDRFFRESDGQKRNDFFYFSRNLGRSRKGETDRAAGGWSMQCVRLFLG
jgi:hypothetical protein